MLLCLSATSVPYDWNTLHGPVHTGQSLGTGFRIWLLRSIWPMHKFPLEVPIYGLPSSARLRNQVWLRLPVKGSRTHNRFRNTPGDQDPLLYPLLTSCMTLATKHLFICQLSYRKNKLLGSCDPKILSKSKAIWKNVFFGKLSLLLLNALFFSRCSTIDFVIISSIFSP